MQAGKAAVFGRLLEVEGIGFNAGRPWPLHVHTIACILQRVFLEWPQASLCRYTIQRPDWLASVCSCTQRVLGILLTGIAARQSEATPIAAALHGCSGA
jgi:hypothetical protein